MTGPDMKAHRLAAGLSRRALADLAGLHPDTVKYWEAKSRVDPYGHAPTKIFATLGLPIPKRHFRSFRRTTRARCGVLGYPPQKPIIAPATCGAKTRKGTPCRAKPIPGKSRCKFHGGLSTGPRTPEGKARIAEAQCRRWAREKVTIEIASLEIEDRFKSGPAS